MADYIAASDVRNRLTQRGYDWVADRDDVDGVVDSTEVARYITTAITYAGELVDEALAGFMEPSDARAQGNGWLSSRCLDIAVARAIENGGRNAPDSVDAARQDAMDRLDLVREEKLKVPNLTYSRPGIGPGQSTRKIRSFRIR
jgi:hypothetical protein